MRSEDRDGTALTIFAGRAGDRNGRGMAGARLIGEVLADSLGLAPSRVGTPVPSPVSGSWAEVLEAARPELAALASHYEILFGAGRRPLTTLSRCAASIATLPVVGRFRSDALVVWFDAHADINVPQSSTTGYLGGMVITGAAGRWDTGLGSGLDLGNVVLVGARDIDPAEQALIDGGVLRHVPPGVDLAARLGAIVGERPVYVHIDCDVLEPGLVPTEYRVPGGLTLGDLRGALDRLAHNEVVGLEIAEFEASWAETGIAATPDALLQALSPLLAGLRRSADQNV
jgi:arginase family enzyme